MISVRFHGRGGQGAVIASKLLATALFKEGWQVQAFPSFGAERTGAPVTAFLRADQKPITAHYQVYEPDHVIVLDPVLLQTINVKAGLVDGGWILVNTSHAPDELELPGPYHVGTVDATGIALANGLGTRTSPIVNTAIIGAFAALTGIVKLESVVEAIPDLVPIKPEANQAAAREAFAQALARTSGAPAGREA